MFDYKKTSITQKITDLLDFYQTSVALAQALQVSRMSLLSWQGLSEDKIRSKNKDNIDFLWCQNILLPAIIKSSQKEEKVDGVSGNREKTLISQAKTLSDLVKKTSFGSLEIESNISQKNFDLVIEQQLTPKNSSVKEVLEIQNICTLNHKIANNLEQDFSVETIKQWHQILMSGVIKNAGEFSKKVRVIPATNLTLTHPDDIEEELQYWLEKHKILNSLSDIAKSHSHFELIHPFSDGNGRIGRSIILMQCLRLGFLPPLINAQNKQMYYATLQHSQKHAEYRPLALFLRHNSKF